MNLRSHHPPAFVSALLLWALLSGSPHSEAQLQAEDRLRPTAGAIQCFPPQSSLDSVAWQVTLKPVHFDVCLPPGWQGSPQGCWLLPVMGRGRCVPALSILGLWSQHRSCHAYVMPEQQELGPTMGLRDSLDSPMILFQSLCLWMSYFPGKNIYGFHDLL